MRNHWTATLALLLLPALCAAHGLLLDASSNGNEIYGSAYYSNGEKAANESIAWIDLSEPGAQAVNGSTDEQGDFRFPAVPGHRYRVSIYGEEGHQVDVELDASDTPAPKLIDDDTQTESALWPPPAWAVIALLLMLSLIPALFSRKSAARGA